MELNDIFTTLAEPNRRAIVEILRRKPRRAGELAHLFTMSAPAMSRHLRVMRASGLVEAAGFDDDARLRVYRLRRGPFVALQAWLDQVEAFWSEQLGAFKAHAERRSSRKGASR